jgi:hypothetical protein
MTYMKRRSLGDTPATPYNPMLPWVPPGLVSAAPAPGGQIWDDIDNFMASHGAVDASQADPADDVNQTATGTGSTSAADFAVVNGVCKARNFPALAASRGFQGQLNRVAQAKGFGKISTDGAIGPATMALFRKVQASAPSGQIMGDASNCQNISADVDVLGQQIQVFADALGSPPTVSGPVLSISPPTIVTKSGQTVLAPDAGIVGSLASLSDIEKLALLGVAGGVGYMLLKKKRPGTIPLTRRTMRRR